MRTIQRSDSNTDSAHKEFRRRLGKIEEEFLAILHKYPETMEHQAYASQFEELQAKLEGLSEMIEDLIMTCTICERPSAERVRVT